MTDCPYHLLVRVVAAGGCTRANPELEQRLGYSNAELAAKPLVDWIHADDRPDLNDVVGAGGGTVAVRHATRSGDWLPLTFTVRSYDNATHVMGYSTPSALVEAPRGDSVESSVDSMSKVLRRMALIVEAKNPGMRSSILLVNGDRDGITVGAGPSMPDEYNDAIEGLKLGPMVGSCGTAAYWNVPVIVENIAEDPLWRDLRGKAAIAGVEACWSQPIRGSNGEVLGALALYSPVPQSPEQYQLAALEIAARMVGIAVERERLEFQLRQTAKFEALGVLAGGAAHDFNNLLAVVIGNVELVKATGAVNDAGREMLDDIIEASESATSICKQMLTYAGRGSVAPEPIAFTEMLRSLTKLLQIGFSKKARLHLELEDDLNVMADSSQLRQVVMNLITNGAEAIGNHQGEVVVTTRALELSQDDLSDGAFSPISAHGEYVEMSVRDTGCGMDAETRANIFDPFFSTKADGRGLGLAAVMGIVKTHGWALKVSSEPGQGSNFVLLLPRSREVVVQDRRFVTAKPSAKTRVLVVDDEPGVLKAIRGILENVGMEVRSATDGAEAIAIYREHHDSIDCVVLDLNMPVLDGKETFKELRAVREDVRVLLTSGYAEQSVLDRFRGAGLSGVLQKPMRASTLLGKIAEALASDV